MSILKNTLKAFLPACLNPEETHCETETKTSRSSCSRLSFFDLSSSCSSFSVLDILNSLVGAKLRIFTLAELRVITRKFSKNNFLGEGGFGPVYKGFIDDKIKTGLETQTVAVKLMDLDGCQGHREWLAEIIFLGQLRHPHLVKLIGYCCEEEHRLLVYEYMTRGNLENQLFRKYYITLPWERRMKIALGAAKGLAFLHEEEVPVIFRDFKSSNILLDADYNPKLSDFGLATDDPQVDETRVPRVMGTKGYAAPEYLMTGLLTTMSDVYSFGVVLLELITGRRAIDEKRPKRGQSLVEWARPILRDPQKLDRLIDPRLEGRYSTQGAEIAASVAYQCLSRYAKCRPTMSNVVKTLEPLVGLDDDFQKHKFCVREENDEDGEMESNWKSCILCRHQLRFSRSRVSYSKTV